MCEAGGTGQRHHHRKALTHDHLHRPSPPSSSPAPTAASARRSPRHSSRPGATVYAGARDPESVTDAGRDRRTARRHRPGLGRRGRRRSWRRHGRDQQRRHRPQRLASSRATSLDGFREELETNVIGPLDVTRAFAPVLAANGGGAVVNILSALSWMTSPQVAGYSATKAALWSLTNAARGELREQGTLVVGVHVGYMDTDMTAGVDGTEVRPRRPGRAGARGAGEGRGGGPRRRDQPLREVRAVRAAGAAGALMELRGSVRAGGDAARGRPSKRFGSTVELRRTPPTQPTVARSLTVRSRYRAVGGRATDSRRWGRSAPLMRPAPASTSAYAAPPESARVARAAVEERLARRRAARRARRRSRPRRTPASRRRASRSAPRRSRERGLGRDLAPDARRGRRAAGSRSSGSPQPPPPVVRIRITSPAATGSASARASTSRSSGPPGSMVTWNGWPAWPPLTPQQARIDRSAIDMKWPSLSIRICFS